MKTVERNPIINNVLEGAPFLFIYLNQFDFGNILSLDIEKISLEEDATQATPQAKIADKIKNSITAKISFPKTPFINL